MKQKWIELRKKKKSIIIVGELTFLSQLLLEKLDQKKKISKDRDLKNTVDQLDLNDVCRTLYHQLQNIYGTFIKIDHVQNHELSANKLKR